MKIGFIAGKPQKSFDCLAERAEAQGHSLKHIPLRDMELSYEGIKNFVLDCQSRFDVLHYYAGLADPIGITFGVICDELNVPLLNNRINIHPSVQDKMFQLLSFSEARLPVPKTEFSRNPSLDKLTKSLGFPIIAKRSRGTHGKHVHLVNDQATLDEITKGKPSQYLFQEFIPHTNDVRVLVLDGKAVCGYRRFPKNDDFRANLAQGGHAEALADEAEREIVFELAQKAVKAVPHELAGVDLIKSETDGIYRLIEINTNPSWYGIVDSTGLHFEDLLLDKYEKLIKESA